MANKIELTSEQLANLDLVISDKRNSDKFFIEVAEACTPTLVVHLDDLTAFIIEAVEGRHVVTTPDLIKYIEIGKNISLNELLEIRNNAIIKK